MSFSLESVDFPVLLCAARYDRYQTRCSKSYWMNPNDVLKCRNGLDVNRKEFLGKNAVIALQLPIILHDLIRGDF